MTSAFVLLVFSIVVIGAGMWLLLQPHRRVSGALVLVAGVALLLFAVAQPTAFVVEGDPSDLAVPPAPQPMPTAQT